MTLRFAVVHEAESDFTTATELADRVLVETIDWLEDTIGDAREWVMRVPTGERLSWKTIPRLAAAIGIKAHGHFDGAPGEPDATAARRAILFLRKVAPDLDAILLIRDRDDQPARRIGLEQARSEKHGTPIIIGLAIVEREAWVLCGFQPDAQEEEVVEDERKRLGFHPCERSHELTACKDDTADRSPKRVLRKLSGGRWERERRCWSLTPTDALRKWGEMNGLADYLNEVRTILGPLIGYVQQK